jgi:Tol biopolymer transport system component
MNADGSQLTRLLPSLSEDPNDPSIALKYRAGVVFGLAWFPDGSKILFGNSEPGNPSTDSLDVIHTDGTGLAVLTDGTLPAWSPDGNFIAFVRDGALYEMRADGQAVHEIKQTAGFDVTSVSWAR